MRNKISSITNFGDSITCGFDALPADGAGYVSSTFGYAGLFDGAVGVPSANFCRGGDQVADTSRLWIYPNANPVLAGKQLYTMLIGTNDAFRCGPYKGCLLNYTQALLASLSWLSLPATDKVLPSAMQASGTWTNDLFFDLGTTQIGSSLTFTVNQTIANRPLFLAFRADDTDTGSAVVSVDGVAATTISTNPNNGDPLLTAHLTPDTILAAMVPLGGIGTHTIRVQTVTPGYFALMWAGVSTADYAQVSASPRVLVGGVTTTGDADLNNTVAMYNSVINTMVAQLAAGGLNVQLVPTANLLNAATDIDDGIHPNNAGHLKMATVFVNAL